VANVTTNSPDFEGGTVLMQARTIFPFTSISQAPQLPPRQPVGIETSALLAAFNQSSPTVSMVVWPWGQRTGMLLIAVIGMITMVKDNVHSVVLICWHRQYQVARLNSILLWNGLC
jgi:hypothetical protein